MERNFQSNPVVSLAAINLLAEILQHDQQMSQVVLQYFEKPSSYKLLIELLNPSKKQTTRTEEIRKIEGSSFGCPVYGFNDAVVNLLQKLLVSRWSIMIVQVPQGTQTTK
jgi:fused-like protein